MGNLCVIRASHRRPLLAVKMLGTECCVITKKKSIVNQTLSNSPFNVYNLYEVQMMMRCVTLIFSFCQLYPGIKQITYANTFRCFQLVHSIISSNFFFDIYFSIHWNNNTQTEIECE